MKPIKQNKTVKIRPKPVDDVPFGDLPKDDVIHTPYGTKSPSETTVGRPSFLMPVASTFVNRDDDENTSDSEGGTVVEKGVSGDTIFDRARVDIVLPDGEYTPVDDDMIRVFCEKVSPLIGIKLSPVKNVASSYLPNAVWELGDSSHLPVYIVGITTPLSGYDNLQFLVSLPDDVMTNLDNGVYVMFYVTYKSGLNDVYPMSGVWVSKVDKLRSVALSNDLYVFDLRNIDCYSYNGMGNPMARLK